MQIQAMQVDRMELATKRFVLRDFVDADLPAFEAYHADPRSLALYGADQAKPGHARELFELFKIWAAERPRLNFQVAIIRRDEPQTLIGCCGLRGKDSESGKAELGIELAPEFWGRFGYAIEAMRSLVDYGFADLGLGEIYGGTVSANTKIGRLASSFGAVAVGRPTPAWMVARGWRQIEWQLSRKHWEQGVLQFVQGETQLLRDRHRLNSGVRATGWSIER